MIEPHQIITDGAFIWNILLTGGYALLVYFVRGKLDELNTTRALLMATREEMARESITRVEFREAIRELTERLDRIAHQKNGMNHDR